jgi:hypothetical protein
VLRIDNFIHAARTKDGRMSDEWSDFAQSAGVFTSKGFILLITIREPANCKNAGKTGLCFSKRLFVLDVQNRKPPANSIVSCSFWAELPVLLPARSFPKRTTGNQKNINHA